MTSACVHEQRPTLGRSVFPTDRPTRVCAASWQDSQLICRAPARALVFFRSNFSISVDFAFRTGPVDPNLRLVSPHSTWVTCQAPESSRRWRWSVVTCHSCRKCEADSSSCSCRRSSCVLPVSRSQARPSSDTAPEGHRMTTTARCRSVAVPGGRAAPQRAWAAQTSRCRSSHDRTRTRHSPSQ